jgi:hypothetical protein
LLRIGNVLAFGWSERENSGAQHKPIRGIRWIVTPSRVRWNGKP